MALLPRMGEQAWFILDVLEVRWEDFGNQGLFFYCMFATRHHDLMAWRTSIIWRGPASFGRKPQPLPIYRDRCTMTRRIGVLARGRGDDDKDRDEDRDVSKYAHYVCVSISGGYLFLI